MTEYEEAICFCAAVYPMVWVWDDGITVRYSQSVQWLPAAVFSPHFPAIIEAGLMDRVENYPTAGYYPNDACRDKAFELWRSAGYTPYYIEPGVLIAK